MYANVFSKVLLMCQKDVKQTDIRKIWYLRKSEQITMLYAWFDNEWKLRKIGMFQIHVYKLFKKLVLLLKQMKLFRGIPHIDRKETA